MSDQAKSAKSGRKSCCLLGCLGLVFLVVAGLLGGTAWIGGLSSRFGEAEELKAQRQELEAAQPFRPAADGRVPPERLKTIVPAPVKRACARYMSGSEVLPAKGSGGSTIGVLEV